MTAEMEFDRDVRQIAEFSKALSHPVRVYILKKLLEYELMLLQRRSG